MDSQNTPLPPQPIAPIVTQSKPKLTTFLIIGVLFLLFIVGTTSYYIGIKQTKSSTTVMSPTQILTPTIASYPTQTITITNETNNWKTYINPQNDFQIKYPNDKNAFVKEGGFFGFCDLDKGETEIRIYSPNYITPAPPAIESDFSGKLIVVIGKKQREINQTIDDWVNQTCPEFLEKDIIKEQFIVNGNQGIKYISKLKETEYARSAFDFIIILKDDSFYFIYGLAFSNEDIKNLFDPILNSFSFTK